MWGAATARKGFPGEWASPERPPEGFGGVSIFSPLPPEPGCGRVAVLGCVLGVSAKWLVGHIRGVRGVQEGWLGGRPRQ